MDVYVGAGEGVQVATGVRVGDGVRVGLQFGVGVVVCADIVPSIVIGVRPPPVLDGSEELGVKLG